MIRIFKAKAYFNESRSFTILLTLTLILFPFWSGSSNETASSSGRFSGILGSAVIRLNQEPTGVIDGAINPELISDRTAYTLLFRVLVSPEQTTLLETERARSFAENAGLEGKQVDGLLAMAEEFRRDIGGLDSEVSKIKDNNWPDPGPDVMQRLAQLQKEKETLVDALAASLPGRLGPKAHQELQLYVSDRFKRKIKLLPTGLSSTKQHHASLRSPIPQPFIPVSQIYSGVMSTLLAPGRVAIQGGMASSAMYSDAWVSSNWNRVWGCGVTEDNYNTYGHQYYVKTTLRSPAGRTVSSTSSTSYSYARVDVSLSWPTNDGDLGNYFANTEHFWHCPYIGSWIMTGNTQGTYKIGRSVICYKFGFADPTSPALVCVYFPIDACNVACKRDEVRLSPPHPEQGCPTYASEEVRWKQREGGPVECKYNQNPMFFSNLPCLCFQSNSPY